VRAISNASSSESRLDANARGSQVDDREDLQNRRKPSIQQDKEPAIVIRQQDPSPHLPPQDDQLMSERRILCFKPTLRLEGRGQDGQDEAE
jgi:hypothetical protein